MKDCFTLFLVIKPDVSHDKLSAKTLLNVSRLFCENQLFPEFLVVFRL